MSKKNLKKGTAVSWKWLGGIVEGNIVEIHHESITKIIKGKVIKRNGSAENPAVVVVSKAGNLALKLASELIVDV